MNVIDNEDAFTKEERYHIRTLAVRRQYLQREARYRAKHHQVLRENLKEELEALDWLFSFFEEVEEDE
jgi:hypothetical protein